ncbi:MAG TPA: hypothetical protein VFG89_06930 [Coriobacteriia bacterium]|nr:hypothetical protein [Coriobacteriia bacterium]
MALRHTTSLVILVAFLAFAILGVLGSPILGGIFVVTAGAVLANNAVRLCPRCSNTACAFNPHASKAASPMPDDVDGQPFSDLPITRTTVLPLLATGPLAFLGAWLYNPIAAVVVAVVALTAHTVFRRVTCSHCGNDCAGNCNPQYRKWKQSHLLNG